MGALILAILVALWGAAPLRAYGADIVSYAIVKDDGTLRVQGRTIRLYGIFIPSRDYTCQNRPLIVPVECGSRSVLALKFKIGSRFVWCDEQWTNRDRSITAVCRIDDEDLAAWMLENGWAAALRDAPFEYELLERIAQSRQIGIWGIPVDSLIRRKGHAW